MAADEPPSLEELNCVLIAVSAQTLRAHSATLRSKSGFVDVRRTGRTMDEVSVRSDHARVACVKASSTYIDYVDRSMNSYGFYYFSERTRRDWKLYITPHRTWLRLVYGPWMYM